MAWKHKYLSVAWHLRCSPAMSDTPDLESYWRHHADMFAEKSGDRQNVMQYHLKFVEVGVTFIVVM